MDLPRDPGRLFPIIGELNLSCGDSKWAGCYFTRFAGPRIPSAFMTALYHPSGLGKCVRVLAASIRCSRRHRRLSVPQRTRRSHSERVGIGGSELAGRRRGCPSIAALLGGTIGR